MACLTVLHCVFACRSDAAAGHELPAQGSEQAPLLGRGLTLGRQRIPLSVCGKKDAAPCGRPWQL